MVYHDRNCTHRPKGTNPPRLENLSINAVPLQLRFYILNDCIFDLKLIHFAGWASFFYYYFRFLSFFSPYSQPSFLLLLFQPFLFFFLLFFFPLLPTLFPPGKGPFASLARVITSTIFYCPTGLQLSSY
jgi:hypothetical protein